MEKKNKKQVIVDLGSGFNPHPSANVLVDLNRNPNLRGVKFIKHDMNKLPLSFKNYSVDEFYMYQCLEHLDCNTEEFLQDIFRCLKTHGTIEINVPNSLCWTYRLEYLFGVIPSDFVIFHKKHFTFNSLCILLRNSGLQVKPRMNWRIFLPFKNILLKNIDIKAIKIQC